MTTAFDPSAVCRTTALILIATERESGLALWLGHFAGQVDKGFDQRVPLHHRHLPQTHLLILCPILCHVGVHSPLILLVLLVTQHNNGDLWIRMIWLVRVFTKSVHITSLHLIRY